MFDFNKFLNSNFKIDLSHILLMADWLGKKKKKKKKS